MRITPFAGLTVLEPGEPFSTDGYSFQDRNPDLTDRLLLVGAVTHRHDQHLALGNPTLAPSASAVASGGSFPAGVDAAFAYTLIDAWGGESLPSDLAEVTTPSKMDAPDPPTASADYAAGGLVAGVYTYVKTWLDGTGGETDPSFETMVRIDPGHASGRVRFTALNSGMAAAGATGWTLYKSANGSSFHFIASGAAATLDDQGQLCADCLRRPPVDNTTLDRNTVSVLMPAASALSSAAVGFRLYGSVDIGFESPSFFGQYPRASGGSTFTFTAFNPGDGSPPPISTTVPGASRIDPDTELVDWPWRRAVANSGALAAGAAGDVRMALDTHILYTPSGASATTPAGWASLGLQNLNVRTGNYTLALSDINGAVEINSSGAVNVTVPPNSSVPFPVGSVCEILRYGAGTVTMVAGAGVTIRSRGSFVAIANQYGAVSIRKRAVDEWVLVGDLT